MDNEAVANKIGSLVLQIWLLEEQLKNMQARINELEGAKVEAEDEDS